MLRLHFDPKSTQYANDNVDDEFIFIFQFKEDFNTLTRLRK